MPEDLNMPAKSQEPRSFRWRGLSFVLVLLIGIFLGRYVVPGAGRTELAPIQFIDVENGNRELIFPTFWEAWDILHKKFDGNLDDEALFYGAVRGLVQAAQDPYTAFEDPQATKQFEETINGSFTGIGVEIGIRDKLPTVIAPLPGSPAERAGIRAADVILKVDDLQLTQDVSLDDVVQRIRGPRGSQVELTVVHLDEKETAIISITRDTIEIESIQLTIEDKIAHVVITSFNSDTATRFTAASREIDRAKVAGIILDLRNNPGGFLQSAVDIASRFLIPGTLVVSERGTEVKEYKAKGNTILANIPVVILVNEGSASASEILAGALQEELKATIIGKQTFGKGSVQEFVKLKDGSSLRVTVARWFTPNGRNISEHGITPDILVEQDRSTEVDEQLQRAREEIKKLSASL